MRQENNDNKNCVKPQSSWQDILYRQVTLVNYVAGLIGLIVTTANNLSGPSQNNDVALKLQDQRITYQQEVIDDLTKTQQNDTQEIKSEVSGLRDEIQALTNQVIKLHTIIEERLPAK